MRCIFLVGTIFFFFVFPPSTKSADHINADPKKYGLIIGIGTYQEGGGWPPIHGDNDIEVISHALITTGFKEENLFVLKNGKATKLGMVSSLERLLQNCSAGDIVLIHFSGHGQQVTDLSGDEADGLDETLVPFDAPSKRVAALSNYDGKKHFTDDELADWFNRFKNKLGATGQLIVLVDACHSGTASRGNGSVRGGMPPFLFSDKSLQKHSSEKLIDESGYLPTPKGAGDQQLSRFILIAAARAEEKDYEHPQLNIGSLSHAVADALENKLKSRESSFRDFFESVRNTMAITVPRQNPQIEGDKDLQLFGGSILIQQPFYLVSGYNKDGLMQLQGGRVLGIVAQTSIGLFPVGTRSVEGKKPISTGMVVKADYLSSVVKLNRSIPEDSLGGLRAFILSPVFDNSQTKVFIDEISSGIKNDLLSKLTAKKIAIVTDIARATLVIRENSHRQIEIIHAIDESLLVNPVDMTKTVPQAICGGEAVKDIEPLDYLIKTVNNFARNNVLKNATFNDNNFNVKIQLLSARIDAQTNKTETLQHARTIPTFNTENSQAVLRLENTGTRTGYVYVIEFDPSGKVCPIVGFDSEVKLPPGGKDETRFEGFVPPYGRYLMKAYISEQPIGNELMWLINEQNLSQARGSSNRLIALLSELMENPGTARTGVQDKSGGVTIANFSYDLQ